MNNLPKQNVIEGLVEDLPLKKMDGKTKNMYVGLLLLTIAIFIAGIYFGKIDEIVVAIPIIALLITILFYDKEFIHVPPAMILLVVITMYVALGADLVADEGILEVITYVLIGIVLGTVGLVVAYMALGKMPGFVNEKPMLITVESFTFGVAVYVLWMVLIYYVYKIPALHAPITPPEIDIMMSRVICVAIGCFAISSMFFLDKSIGIFKHAVVGFLGKNSNTIGIESNEKEETLELINKGESDDLEFKSTLRTNLQTGEKDKRMEKAVLKTIVAFLNSNGGTLLVGVADNGDILGMDIESFDNRDKLNLHVTNLLSSQVGDEFIPFIRFKQIDFDDKVVLKFVCSPTSSPVFYKEGKDEIFFVRSGPSSVELSGTDLLNYADNRRKLKRKKKYAAAKPISQQL